MAYVCQLMLKSLKEFKHEIRLTTYEKFFERDLIKVLNARTPLEEFVFPPPPEEEEKEELRQSVPEQPASVADEKGVDNNERKEENQAEKAEVSPRFLTVDASSIARRNKSPSRNVINVSWSLQAEKWRFVSASRCDQFCSRESNLIKAFYVWPGVGSTWSPPKKIRQMYLQTLSEKGVQGLYLQTLS